MGNPRIVHGFYTRIGGQSDGIYQSLNVGQSSEDNPENIARNRQAIVQNLGLCENDVITPWQHHSSDVVVATKQWGNNRPKADALVTSTPGLPIGVITADCGPVLFCDAANEIIGAAHAGWKGATSGVLENTIDTMIEHGANIENIRATLGPAISGKNYEVGPEFVENLLGLDGQNQKYLTPSHNNGHALFDLPAYIINRLIQSGVNARSTGPCTYQNESQFFSYRRMTHRGETDYGRQISAIAIIKKY
ncbi:MAG: peptidoglycan editing factor PgeF [Hyphomicrobiales bacterium]|nr:peptidoglycan editing factor PgeF [Hyphomicrobiales bacterium]